MSELEGSGREPGQLRSDMSEDCDFNQTIQNWGENPNAAWAAWAPGAQDALATRIFCTERALRN